MKRVMYVSSATAPMIQSELDALGEVSARNNARVGVTGMLISAREFFFQLLEGEAQVLNPLLARIQNDPRHSDLRWLKVEEGVDERVFPEWSMKTVRLDAPQNAILEAVRYMLEQIASSHRIIERYTQPSVVRSVAANHNPLLLPVRRVERIILFVDLVGYTQLAARFSVEVVADTLNRFLEVASVAISEEGGTVSKYIGDCVMAYFDASDAHAATRACERILSGVQTLREDPFATEAVRSLRCSIGMAAGEVMEGNIGSSVKLDYTVIGDAVNLAARLEGLTRALGVPIVVDARVAARAGEQYVALGTQAVRGLAEPVPTYTLREYAPQR